ncbi:MAG: hypothetical protein LW855_05615 [Alphaproteobacteria bacterium]|jgi:hypothetical protein|nr:hypothetical protein [Thalassospira sp.]MCE2965253.1 hypothetical protein [Alphaproteobacteria bacterium]
MKQWQNPKWNFPAKAYLGCGLLLLIAAAPLPYGFYTFLKITVCGFSAVLSYKNFNATDNNSIWAFFFLFIAILFNPFVAIHMPKEIWVVVDIILGLLFLFLAHKVRTA